MGPHTGDKERSEKTVQKKELKSPEIQGHIEKYDEKV